MQALAPHANLSLMATTPKVFSAGNVAHDEIPAGLFGSNAFPHESMKPKLLPATMATESAPMTQPQNVSSLNCQLHSITVVYSSMEHGALHNTDKRFPATMATESAPMTQPQEVSSLNCQLHSTVVAWNMKHCTTQISELMYWLGVFAHPKEDSLDPGTSRRMVRHILAS